MLATTDFAYPRDSISLAPITTELSVWSSTSDPVGYMQIVPGLDSSFTTGRMCNPHLAYTLPILLLLGLSLSAVNSTIIQPPSVFSSDPQDALAQSYIQTTKKRSLSLNLGNGLRTNAELILPNIGEGPFPSVLYVAGSGVGGINSTIVNVTTWKTINPFWQLAQYLGEFLFDRESKDSIQREFDIAQINDFSPNMKRKLRRH